MIPATRLLRRAGPGRRREAAAVKAELAAAHRRGSTDEARAIVRRAAQLRDELASLVGMGRACAGCAAGYPFPEGAYPGGRCCAGPTADVFQPVEIDLLAARGIFPKDLGPPPREPDGGCAFRGAAGCSLPLRARPTICVHYVCRDLMAELAADGVAPRVGELREQLGIVMGQLAVRVEADRNAAELDELFEP